MPGFHSLPLELLHFVWAIKYSLSQREKSKRLILLPSCSGAHLGCERCRVKSFLWRWFNYLYKVEQLQQEGHTCRQAWRPSPALHKTSSLLISRVTWCRFFPCQVNVSCLHRDLLTSCSCFLSQGSLGRHAAQQDSRLRLLTGRHGPLPTGNSFLTRVKDEPFAEPCAHLSPWHLSSLRRGGSPGSCNKGQALRGSREPEFPREFPGLAGASVNRAAGKIRKFPYKIRKTVKFPHPVGFSVCACMWIIYFTSLMTGLLLLFSLPADTIIQN